MLWDLVALSAAKKNHFETAAAILIHGDAYLRPCEILAATRECVIQPRSSVQPQLWGLVIAPMEAGVPIKAGEFDDTILFNSPQRGDVNAVVKVAYAASHGSSKLFPSLSYRTYCKWPQRQGMLV